MAKRHRAAIGSVAACLPLLLVAAAPRTLPPALVGTIRGCAATRGAICASRSAGGVAGSADRRNSVVRAMPVASPQPGS